MICIKENCLLAGADQPLENFYFRKDSGKYRNECKVCWKAATRKFAIDYPEQTRELSKQYRVKHAEEKKVYQKQYREENKEEIREAGKKYRDEHKEELAQYNYEYKKERLKNDKPFRMLENLRKRMRDVIHGKNKSESTIELIGCSPDNLKKHLESMFRDGMTWDNYGTYWVVDHFIPCAFFDFSKPHHQRLCFHFINLWPLTAKENLSKGDSIWTIQQKRASLTKGK